MKNLWKKAAAVAVLVAATSAAAAGLWAGAGSQARAADTWLVFEPAASPEAAPADPEAGSAQETLTDWQYTGGGGGRPKPSPKG